MPEWKRLIHHHLARLRLPPEREMEIAEEMAQHLESVYSEALAGGLTPEAAQARVGRDCRLARAGSSPHKNPEASGRA